MVKLDRRDFCFNVLSKEQGLVSLPHLFVLCILSLEIREGETGGKKV